MFQIETERLLIRPWTAADRPAYAALTTDPEVMRYVNNGKPYSEQELDDALAMRAKQLAENGFCMGALVEKATGEVVGISGLQPLGTTPWLEVGWILAQNRWGRGYATEAGAAAMRYVLETLGRDRVVAIIDVDNEPSKRVAARLGMSYDARYTGAELGHRKPQIVVDLYYRDRG